MDLLVPPGTPWPRRRGIRATRIDPPDNVVLENGVSVTDPWRTALDCARFLPRYAALSAVDAFTRSGVSADLLAERGGGLRPGSRGCRQAAEVLALADRRAESPGESWTRLLILDAGLPAPEPQVSVRCGHEVFRLDLGYRDEYVGIEYDGRRHHTSPDDRQHDARRRALIRSAGWDIVVLHAEDLRTRPRVFLEALLDVLLTHGWHARPERINEIRRRIARISARARHQWR